MRNGVPATSRIAPSASPANVPTTGSVPSFAMRSSENKRDGVNPAVIGASVAPVRFTLPVTLSRSETSPLELFTNRGA